MIESNFPEAHVIDINELVHFMTREQTYPLQDNKTELAVIHVVKRHVRDKDNEMYKPEFLSIGPYYHGSPAVQDMHKVKFAYLDYILKLNPEKTLANYLSAIKGIEKQVKYAYANEIKMDKDTFLKILLLDGCFILVALNGIEGILLPKPDCNRLDANTRELDVGFKVIAIGQTNGITQSRTEKMSKEENIKGDYYHHEMVLRDILLLENQIPFCVVKKIFEVLIGRIDATSLLTNNIGQSILLHKISHIPTQIREDLWQKESYHLLHLCHILFEPSQKQLERHRHHSKPQFLHHILHSETQFLKRNEQAIMPHILDSESSIESQQLHHWRRATHYHEANIDFKKRELYTNNEHSLFDIEFCSGTVKIPPLSVDPTTCCLLGNLVAFEQACPQFGSYVTSYVLFWSQLVSTPDDAAMLIKKGIIINHLHSDKEVTELFSALSEDVAFDFNGENYLKPLCHMVEAHYQCQKI